MFKPCYYNLLHNYLGANPTIGVLLAVPHIYCTSQKGTLIFVTNNLIYYEPDPEGAKTWNMLKYTLFRIMDWSIELFVGNSLCEVIDPLDSTLDSENSLNLKKITTSFLHLLLTYTQ